MLERFTRLIDKHYSNYRNVNWVKRIEQE
jgi:hypothetical protein